MGHIPKLFSKICKYVLLSGGKILVTGKIQNTRKNGLEVPCQFTFKGQFKEIEQEKLSRKCAEVVKYKIDSHIDVSCFLIFLAKAVYYDPLISALCLYPDISTCACK